MAPTSLVEALEVSSWHEFMAGKCGSQAKSALQPLQKFCPTIEDGVIRIGGRLQRSKLSKDFKYPMIDRSCLVINICLVDLMNTLFSIAVETSTMLNLLAASHTNFSSFELLQPI